MAWPPTIPPATRTDTTVMASSHPSDHNNISNTLTELVSRVGLGYITSAFITANVSGLTGAAAITGMTVTYTALANRRYRITGSLYGFNQVGAGAVDLTVRRVTPGNVAIQSQLVSRAAGDSPTGACIVAYDTPAAGTTNYVLAVGVTATSVTVYATAGARGMLLVEDIGPA